MSDTASETTTPAADPTPPASAPSVPVENAVSATSFKDVPVQVRRNADKNLWEAYLSIGGAEWVIASRKLGGLDDDLQEAATPGFKEKRRLYYEREVLGLR